MSDAARSRVLLAASGAVCTCKAEDTIRFVADHDVSFGLLIALRGS